MGSRYPHLSENSPGESIGVVLPSLGKGVGMDSGPITVDKLCHHLPAQPKDEEWITCTSHNHSALLHTTSNEEDIAWW